MNARYDELETLPDAVAALRARSVPHDVLKDARYALVDTLAAAAYPIATTVPAMLHVEPAGRRRSVGVWWTGRRVDMLDAAFANAYRAHSSDFDSIHYLTFGHPAAVALPPLLGLYECGASDPISVLVGYVISVEIMVALGARFGPALRAATYHPTVVLGAPACAASCTWVLGGDAAAIRWAMAYAASTTIGFDSHFGGDIKPLQVAACARAGLHAAQLAVQGNWAPPGVPWYTPIATLAAADRAGSQPHVFGQPWSARIVPTRCKLLPICGYFDSVLAAWRDRPDSLASSAASVQRVTVEGPEYLMQANRFASPTTLNETRFSLPFLIALLLRHQNVTPLECVLAQLADPEVRRIMAVVGVVPAPAGEQGVIRVLGERQEWILPLRSRGVDVQSTWTQIKAKLVGAGLAAEIADELVAHVLAFESSTSRRWKDLVSIPKEVA